MIPLVLTALLLPAQAKLPKVVLVGDSIRNAYAPEVKRLLAGEAEFISPEGAGDSSWLLKNLDALVLDHKPDLVHFNVGLHDLRKARKDGKYQIDAEEYEKNLHAVFTRLRKAGVKTFIFALTTPVDDERGKRRKGGFDRLDADVERYNGVAWQLAGIHNRPLHDLNTLVKRHGGSKLIAPDGTHFTKEGVAIQARAVADCVRRHLYIAAYKTLLLPAADEKATADYKAAEAKRDAGVPAVYKKLKVPDFTVPKDADDWKKRRMSVRTAVERSLGEMPDRPTPSAGLLSVEHHPDHGYTLESLLIPNGMDEEMTALLLLPHSMRGKKAPAILWLHSSSPDARQLLVPGTNGGETPLSYEFARAGYAVLAPDACWYGGRAGKGPGGTAETNAAAQHQSLFKYHMWFGRTLWGMFVRDDRCALDYLCTRPEIDASRIGATGMSMGSTRSWWLMALDERVKCAVGVACLTRYQNLLAHGEARQHGVYYFVFGLLKHFDVEGVLALMAPRPFLALNGELDAGSPLDGIREIERRVGGVYAALGAEDAFRSVTYKHTGHVYTPGMRKEMLAWFAKWLKKA